MRSNGNTLGGASQRDEFFDQSREIVPRPSTAQSRAAGDGDIGWRDHDRPPSRSERLRMFGIANEDQLVRSGLA